MREERLEECRAWAEITDENLDCAGLRLPDGMATEMVEEIDRLNGRLQAVCDVVNNAAAFGDSPEAGRIMEAVRGE